MNSTTGFINKKSEIITSINLEESYIKVENSYLAKLIQQLQCFIDYSDCFYWEEDKDYRYSLIIDKTGQSKTNEKNILIGTVNWELGGLPINDNGIWKKHIALKEAKKPYDRFVVWSIDSKGEEQYLSFSGQPIFSSSGQFEGYCGICKNITEEKVYQQYANTSELAAIGICHVNQKREFIYVNRYLCQMLGYTKDELLNMTLAEISFSEKEQIPLRERNDLINNKINSFKMEKRYKKKDGSIIWASLTIAMKHAPDGKPSYDISIIEDISARKKSEERVQYLATHDEMTDLPNRTLFSQMLQHAINTADRYKRKFAVIFLDLDRFKQINDSFGHETGDKLLIEMSNRLKSNLRSSDLVARLGGDEFVILAQEISTLTTVEKISQKILSSILEPLKINEKECRITASIGIAIYPNDAKNALSLMKNADIAMYLAKEEGKNNFLFYSNDMQSQSMERLTLETNLRNAMDNNEFEIHYQPKVDIKSVNVNGVEALLRWNNPDLGSVSPVHFIPIAEEIGLIVPLGKWVLMKTCKQAIKWQNLELPEIVVSVNLSPRQFQDPELLPFIQEVLDETGIAPELLELEITETMMANDSENAMNKLLKIKEMGIKIAIDDFGVGYSSLSQLKLFPIDTLKVDRIFIRETPHNLEDCAIAKAIIEMGKSLSLKIVVEGVESAEQVAFLKDLECDEIQGFYYSKPLSEDNFLKLMINGNKNLTSQV